MERFPTCTWQTEVGTVRHCFYVDLLRLNQLLLSHIEPPATVCGALTSHWEGSVFTPVPVYYYLSVGLLLLLFINWPHRHQFQVSSASYCQISHTVSSISVLHHYSYHWFFLCVGSAWSVIVPWFNIHVLFYFLLTELLISFFLRLTEIRKQMQRWYRYLWKRSHCTKDLLNQEEMKNQCDMMFV